MVTQSNHRFCPSCGAALSASGECSACLLQLGISHAPDEPPAEAAASLPTLEELDRQFPQLELTRLIGRGGMGAIYHARQKTLDRDVALKLISKEVSSDAAFVERFEREAKALAKLSHPNIVTIFDFGRTEDGTAYLVMEFVDGINLREAISAGGIGSDEALEIVSTICKALAYAHSKGVVHRDIKPENILLGEDGSLKVADFGIAKIVDDSVRTPTLTATRQVLGSLHYLAPEHLESPSDVDHRVDLYALGVIFYELLTGQLPLGRFEPPSVVRGDVDGRLDAVVLKTLSRRPSERYQHAIELESAVGELLVDPPPAAAKPSAAPAAGRQSNAIGVPFTCDALSGFAEAVGIVHARDGRLCAEFRIRDVFGGSVKSKTHIVEIPSANLSKLELLPGVFSSKLIITADTIAALGAFPDAETGRAKLAIKRSDDESARRLVQALGFPVDAPMDNVRRRSAKQQDANRMIFAVMMLICGVLNGGGLAITEAVLVEQLVSGAAFVAAAVGVAVAVGPIAVIQILTGILNLFAHPRSLNLAASVASMIPLTPIWLLSFPTGIWAYRWLTDDETPTAMPAATAPWGSTTLMFLRESRWSKLVGILNGVGAVVLLAGITIYNFGCYSTTMNYRVIDTDVGRAELETAVRARLAAVSGTQHLRFDARNTPHRMSIKTWQRHSESIATVLAVAESPQWVWLQAVDAPVLSDFDEQQLVPVAPQLRTSALQVYPSKLGEAAMALSEPQSLAADWVRAVQVTDDGELELTLTSEGRIALETVMTNESGVLGLLVDDLVLGLAIPDQESVAFELATGIDLAPGAREQRGDSEEITAAELAAGIRGPRLPSPVERVR